MCTLGSTENRLKVGVVDVYNSHRGTICIITPLPCCNEIVLDYKNDRTSNFIILVVSKKKTFFMKSNIKISARKSLSLVFSYLMVI